MRHQNLNATLGATLRDELVNHRGARRVVLRPHLAQKALDGSDCDDPDLAVVDKQCDVLTRPHANCLPQLLGNEQAALLATSMQQAFVNLRSGRPARLPPPVADYPKLVGPAERALLDSVLSCAAIGAPDTVRASLNTFIARTGADELMITSQIFDHAARLRSYEITAGLFQAG